jgi:hypothetical protein
MILIPVREMQAVWLPAVSTPRRSQMPASNSYPTRNHMAVRDNPQEVFARIDAFLAEQ